MNRIKIAIIFGTEPNFEVYAFKYFILALNKNQKTYEFFFPDVEVYPIKVKEKRLDSDEWQNDAKAFINEKDIIAECFIFIVSKGFKNNYFFRRNGNYFAITTDTWDKYFSPPSLFEYLFHSIYTCLLYSKAIPEGIILTDEQKNIVFESHIETKGCIADFTRDKFDDKIDIALGYICEEDTKKIMKCYGSEYFKEFERIIDRKWIGDKEQVGSIAYNLKHIFKFDIDRDSGFNKSFWDKIKGKFHEIPANIILVILTAITMFFLMKLGIVV